MNKASDYVRIEDLSKTYSTGKSETHALQDISFNVGRKEFVTVIGQSGCGKSTLLKIIAGLEPRTGGNIFIDGVRVEGPQLSVGMVFQTPALLPWRRVLGNTMLPADILKLNKAESLKKANELLDLVGLSEFKDRYPLELSGGMQQRVSICRALLYNPSILLMDEPFGSLDAITRDQLNVELLRIWRVEHKTVIFVTHNIPESVFLADKIVLMTPRPSTVQEIFEIDLPRPRTPATRATSEYGQLCLHITNKLIKGVDERVKGEMPSQ